MLNLTNPLPEFVKRGLFVNNSIDDDGGIEAIASAATAVGGFVGGKFIRGTVNQKIMGMDFASKGVPLLNKTSWGDLIASVGTVVLARMLGSFLPPEYRGPMEGGAAAAALHTMVAPYLPQTLQGVEPTRYAPKSVDGTIPTNNRISGVADDHANASAYNVAVGGVYMPQTPYFN